MTQCILVEPQTPGAAWAPFGGVRPIADLRAGAWRVRDRWQEAVGLPVTRIVASHVEGFAELDQPPVSRDLVVRGPAVIAAAWFAPLGPVVAAPGTERLTHSGTTVARFVAPGEEVATADALSATGRAVELDGVTLVGAHSLVAALEALLERDCANACTISPSETPDGAIVIGDARLVASRAASVEPGVVFDVRHGPVILEAGVEVRSGTRFEGPCWIGAGARIVGGFIRTSVIGPMCVVRGEVAMSVFNGYSNKAHDGFIGHSVIGHWVNLGAGTTTSNLKNTYGPVRLSVGPDRIETGRTFLGSLVGDHAKTAIGTLLNTGTVIGAGANVFGPGAVPKYVPPFAWGGNGTAMAEETFLRVAARVMPRRNVELTPERAESLRATYRRAMP